MCVCVGDFIEASERGEHGMFACSIPCFMYLSREIDSRMWAEWTTSRCSRQQQLESLTRTRTFVSTHFSIFCSILEMTDCVSAQIFCWLNESLSAAGYIIYRFSYYYYYTGQQINDGRRPRWQEGRNTVRDLYAIWTVSNNDTLSLSILAYSKRQVRMERFAINYSLVAYCLSLYLSDYDLSRQTRFHRSWRICRSNWWVSIRRVLIEIMWNAHI